MAVVDDDPAVRSRLAMQLGAHAVPFPSIEALATKLTGTPLVVVLGPSWPRRTSWSWSSA